MLTQSVQGGLNSDWKKNNAWTDRGQIVQFHSLQSNKNYLALCKRHGDKAASCFYWVGTNILCTFCSKRVERAEACLEFVSSDLNVLPIIVEGRLQGEWKGILNMPKGTVFYYYFTCFKSSALKTKTSLGNECRYNLAQMKLQFCNTNSLVCKMRLLMLLNSFSSESSGCIHELGSECSHHLPLALRKEILKVITKHHFLSPLSCS